MKLMKSLLLCGLLLTGCTINKEPIKVESIKVLSPTGAPALAMLGASDPKFADEYDLAIDYVTGSDTLSAELVKENSEYDVIIAPINLGTKMIQAGKSEYRLDSIITWGNLYVAATSENALITGGEFATFGEGSVVDYVLQSAINLENVVPNITYYASAQDVQAAFLSGKANVGMLAEPALTATINKAKENGIELSVIMDLQEMYQATMSTDSKGFPQAAIFVKQGAESRVALMLSHLADFVNVTALEDPSYIETRVDEVGSDVLGVPSGALAKATWAKQNIRYTKANEAVSDITVLLSLMDITFSEDMLSK